VNDEKDAKKGDQRLKCWDLYAGYSKVQHHKQQGDKTNFDFWAGGKLTFFLFNPSRSIPPKGYGTFLSIRPVARVGIIMVHRSSGFLPLLVIHLMVMSWQHHHIQQVDASSAQQQQPRAAFMTTTVGRGTALSYDDVTDRIYITGDRDDDCWLGILQLPATAVRHHGDVATVPATTSAGWIRNVNLGLADQTESCTAVRTCRTGNSRRLFITGISFGGSSLLQTTTNETTTATSAVRDGDAADNTAAVGSSLLSGRTADTPATTAPSISFNRTSGWLWDISWYGEVIVRFHEGKMAAHGLFVPR
jgi:hypothetical protein